MATNTQVFRASLGAIEFLDIGTGHPVLYFHGTGAASDAAALLEQSLVDSGCRLIIPNRPGYYATSAGPSGSAEFSARMAVRLLDELGIDRVIVIGTSGGGMPAAAFSRMYAERTAALVLQCAQAHSWTDARWLPHGIGSALFLFRNRYFYPLLRWQNARHACRGYRNPKWSLRRMAGQRATEIENCPRVMEKITSLAEMTVRCAKEPAGIQNDWSMLVGDNGILPGSISAPTLIIHDECDPLVPFAHAQWARQCIEHSQLLSIHAGGHLIWIGKDAELMHQRRMRFIEVALNT